MNSTFTQTQLTRRADRIIRTVRTGKISPKSDAMIELAEILDELEDLPVKPKVVARMTVRRTGSRTTIYEVVQTATFSRFFRIFAQDGRRRSTKRLVRVSDRNDGIFPPHAAYRMTPGLERLAEYWQRMPGVESIKVRIIRRRDYKHLIQATPDELGMTQTHSLPVYLPTVMRSQ